MRFLVNLNVFHVQIWLDWTADRLATDTPEKKKRKNWGMEKVEIHIHLAD